MPFTPAMGATLSEPMPTSFSINIKLPDASALPTGVFLPPDGFFIACTVKDNTESYSYVPENDDWTYNGISYGPVHTRLRFYAVRLQLLPQFPAYHHISFMLDKAHVPFRAQQPLILEIHQAIVSIADHPSYAAPRVVPILVEITRWKSNDIFDNAQFVSEDEEEEIDAEMATVASSLSMEENEPKTTPAARSAIELLKKEKVTALDAEKEVCTICLDQFLEGAEVTYMPCKHAFHGDCIAKWLKSSNICPLCRFEMPVRDPSE